MATPAYSFRVIWSDDDDAYVATSPEFDGVSGIGDRPETALQEARAALRLAVETYEAEGWPLPAADALAHSSGQFRLRLPRALHARLVERAADEGVSLNSYAISLIAAGIGTADAKAELQRCVDGMLTDLRSVIQGGVLAHASQTTAFARVAPQPDLLVASANVASGGSPWQS